MRYAVRHQPPRSFGDDIYEDVDRPIVFFPTVFDGDDYVETGLVDEHGNDILKFVGILPIGFLADHSEE